MVVIADTVLSRRIKTIQTAMGSKGGIKKQISELPRETVLHELAHILQLAHDEESKEYEKGTRGEEPPSQYAKRDSPSKNDLPRYLEDFPETIVASTYNRRGQGVVRKVHKTELDKFRAVAHSGIAIPTIVTCRQIDPTVSIPAPLTEKKARNVKDSYVKGIKKALSVYDRYTKRDRGLQYANSTYGDSVRESAGRGLRSSLEELRSQIKKDMDTESADKLDYVRGGLLEQLARRFNERALETLLTSERRQDIGAINSSLRRTETTIPTDNGTLHITHAQDDSNPDRNIVIVEMISNTPQENGVYPSTGIRIMIANGDIRQVSSQYRRDPFGEFNIILPRDQGGSRNPYVERETDSDAVISEMQRLMQYLV